MNGELREKPLDDVTSGSIHGSIGKEGPKRAPDDPDASGSRASGVIGPDLPRAQSISEPHAEDAVSDWGRGDERCHGRSIDVTCCSAEAISPEAKSLRRTTSARNTRAMQTITLIHVEVLWLRIGGLKGKNVAMAPRFNQGNQSRW